MMMDEPMTRVIDEYAKMLLKPSLEVCAITAPSMIPRLSIAP